MARPFLQPEAVLRALKKGELAPFYLFCGPDEFRMEKLLDQIREIFIPESSRDFNLEIFYGEKGTDPGDIVARAMSLPFMARNRLIIVRRIEEFQADQLVKFLPYLEKPVESTCLIFISSKTDFRIKFFIRIRASGLAVNFFELKETEVLPWIKHTANNLGLKIDAPACRYLFQVVGNRPRDLHVELEKLYLRYGEEISVGFNQVKELIVHSRIYTVFQLMNAISLKNSAESLNILNRFLEEEDIRNAPFQVIGMLNRQIKLIWNTKSVLKKGGGRSDVAKKLGPSGYFAKDFIDQSKQWSEEDLATGLNLLYQADGFLKTGSRPKPVMENLVLLLCL